MIKLYRSAMHPKQWIAYVEGSGWVIFPARENGWESRQPATGPDPLYLRPVPGWVACPAGENGWESRQPATGLDPMYLRQVPVRMAECTGLPQPEFCGVA